MNFLGRLARFLVNIGGDTEAIAAPAPATASAAPASPGTLHRPTLPQRESAAPEVIDGARTRSFVAPELLSNLPNMSAVQLDLLDFGCIKVDDTGVILSYNKWQSEFANVDQREAIGKHFFRELAPCTNNRLVYGRFKDGVAAGELDTLVTYAFTYKMRPSLVRVHLFRHVPTRTNWVMVKRMGGVK